MTDKSDISLKPTKRLWGVTTSISLVRNFFETKDEALAYITKGHKSLNFPLSSIIDITKYDYYDKLGEFSDVVSVQGLKSWSNSIPYFQVCKNWDTKVRNSKLTKLEATTYGMKVLEDRFNEAGVYYLDYISPCPVPSALFAYDGTSFDDIYRAFECPRVIKSKETEVRRYQDMPDEKIKEFKL